MAAIVAACAGASTGSDASASPAGGGVQSGTSLDIAACAARLGLEQVVPDRTETEGEDEEHVDSQDLKSLRAAEAQCEDLEVPLDVVDMEESAAAEAEAMMEAQAQAAALIDTLQGDMHTCGRCQEIVLEVNMAPATSGEFPKQLALPKRGGVHCARNSWWAWRAGTAEA